jgi:hypothetical protein
VAGTLCFILSNTSPPTRISRTQQGLIAEHEFAKLLMIGSGGQIEVSSPMTDEERRDMEIHIRGRFGPGLAFQVKSTTYRHRQRSRKAYVINIHFTVRPERLISHPLFWYFLACLDLEAMAFVDPVFLIPSAQVHEHGSRVLKDGTWYYNVAPSLDSESNDLWHAYQCSPRAVGEHVLQILKNLPLGVPVAAKTAARLPALPGVLWARIPTKRRPVRLRRRPR